MADRTKTLGGWIWANGAADPPAIPVSETTYANSSLSEPIVNEGWPYSKVVDSANFNEIMQRITLILASAETYGILAWYSGQTYPAGALAMGSDGEVYKAKTSNSGQDPTLDVLSTYWERPFAHWAPGDIKYTAAATPPHGFLAANGAAISRASYALLFAVIGTTYGAGDGATTFNLPDLRGEFIRGLDSGRGVDIGRVLGSSQSATTIGNQANNNATLSILNPDSSTNYSQGLAGHNITATVTAQRIGVRPRNVAMLACIKY